MSAYLTLTDLTKPQQLALLTLLGGDLAQASADALRVQGCGPMSSADFIALQQAGLAIRLTRLNKLVLTPIGKFRARDLARPIAVAAHIHVETYGRCPNGGAYYVRCSCGRFTVYKSHAIKGAMAKLANAVEAHKFLMTPIEENKPAGSRLLLEPLQ